MPEYSRKYCRFSEASCRKSSTDSELGPFTSCLPRETSTQFAPVPQLVSGKCGNRRAPPTQISLARWKAFRNVLGKNSRRVPVHRKTAAESRGGVLPRNTSARSCKKCSRVCPRKLVRSGSSARTRSFFECAHEPDIRVWTPKNRHPPFADPHSAACGCERSRARHGARPAG